MTNSYQPKLPAGRWLLLALLLLAGTLRGQAQSGPYGNEWIVQGQPYYKLKVWRDGLYRLDYAYLSALGAGAVAPAQLQLWRRGKEVAVYQGGNAAALDATSFLEFYGQRNDGALDKDYYKSPRDQANPYYSYFTDTASYFITWGSRAGKRMAQPTASGGTPHAWRLQSTLKLHTEAHQDAPAAVPAGVPSPTSFYTYEPWLDVGEGFCGFNRFTGPLSSINDSLLRAVATGASTLPRAEVMLGGGTNPIDGHFIRVSVIPPGGTARNLSDLTFPDYTFRRSRYSLQFGDIDSNGKIEISAETYRQPIIPILSYWHYYYTRLTVPQQVVWFSDRRSVFFQNDSLLAGVATYDVPGVPATVAGFDVHDPWNVQRIAPTASGSAARFVFPNATTAQTRNLLLADESRPLVPPSARRVVFASLNAATADFFIVTHPKLMGASGTVPNAAQAYANYRESAAGGGYHPLMVTAPQLYDQFHYGERSVLAVRHFALWAAANSAATQNRYLLLLGKGITTGSSVVSRPRNDNDDYPGSYLQTVADNTTRTQGELGLDLVPTTTRSPSDSFFSSDWPTGNYVPRLITGRVVASTPGEVVAYLNKLRDYESKISPTEPNPEPWHKAVVNLVGGERQSDFDQFGSIMNRYAAQMQRPYLGATVTTLRRTVPAPNPAPSLNISSQVNAGLQLISYFGHGSPNFLDVDLGDITNPLSGYANAGKYPVMFFNGCAVGACFFVGRTFGSDWILSDNKGAVGLLSESGFSYTDLIDTQQSLINRLLFNDPAWFGQPVAAVQREAVRRLQNTPQFPATGYFSNEATEQLMGTIWHGDPAVRFFAPAKPDLVTSNANLTISPASGATTVTAASPQYVLTVGVSNPARITYDSVEIRVKRTWGAGSNRSETYRFGGPTPGRYGKAFRQSFRRDTTYALTLPLVAEATGDNTFTVDLDYRNQIDELSELNNTATLNYSFLSSGVTLLTPSEFAVVGTNTPRLVAQSNNPNEAPRSYDIQVDTTSTFATGIKTTVTTTATARTLVDYTPPALVAAAGRDSVVWYWRVRFSAPGPGESALWATGSFRVIAGAPAGWSQSHNGQFNRDELTGVAVAAPTNRWSFTDRALPVRLRTAGGARGNVATFPSVGGTILTDLASAPDLSACGNYAPNLLIAVLDSRSGQRVTVAGGTYSTCGNTGQTFYTFGNSSGGVADTLDNLNNSAARRTELLTFLDNVPNNSYVLLVSANRLRFTDPALATVRQKLATVLGSALIGQLRTGEPWALAARKQASGGTLLSELGPDRASGTPTYAQTIVLNASLVLPGVAGQVQSTLIGPSREWQQLFSQVRPGSATSRYTLSLIGVAAGNQEVVLRPNITTKRLDLSGIPATTYPYLRLRLTLRDSTNNVPAQLRQWMLSYKGLPEGIVRRDLVDAAAYDPARLAQQAKVDGYISFPVKFSRVAPEPFTDRLKLQVSLYDASGNLARYPSTGPGAGTPVQLLVTANRDLSADSALTFESSLVRLRVIGLFGTFTPVAVVNPQPPTGQPEQYYFNNELRLPPFTVVDTNVPPTLDVAVDGRHILNGEIVSPTPVISIQLRDEDKLRPITDVSAFKVYLQRAGQPATLVTDPSLLRFTVTSDAQGSVARLEYVPGKNTPLENGIYTLQVQGTDQSSATAAAQTYQVKFEVVRESSITNVLPYPNPMTSKARFAFTVTGSELPRNMKIQILTLTGKVVREIFMNELGPLHIGSNLTDYAWDGTDQYGDRLANGTYLYRVLLDDEGKFVRRATAADQAFKNDWGKLVLLR